MKIFNYFPHRVLANRALQRTADEIRKEIEEQRAICENEQKKLEQELQQALERRQKDLETIKQDYQARLESHFAVLSGFNSLLYEYGDLYFERKLLKEIQRIRIKTKKAYEHESEYLRKQAKLLQADIGLLEERKSILAMQVDVSEFTETLGLMNSRIEPSESNDARALLKRIDEMLQAEQDPSTISALKLLRKRIRERSEYISEISYITWMSIQKANLKNMLSSEARKSKSMAESIEEVIQEETVRIQKLDGSLAESGKRIWDIIDAPINEIYSERESIKAKHKKLVEKVKAVQNEIDWRYRLGPSSDYDYRQITGLKEERTSIQDEIERLSIESKLSHLKSEEEEQKRKKNAILAILKETGIYLEGKEIKNR